MFWDHWVSSTTWLQDDHLLVNLILFSLGLFKNKTKMHFSTSFIPHISQYIKSVPKYKEIGSPKLTHNPFLNSDLSTLSLLSFTIHCMESFLLLCTISSSTNLCRWNLGLWMEREAWGENCFPLLQKLKGKIASNALLFQILDNTILTTQENNVPRKGSSKILENKTQCFQ